MKKLLFVVTSHGELGDTGRKTGYWVSEVTHPWEVLTDAGYEIDFVSPKGGKSPTDGNDPQDVSNKRFFADKAAKNKIENSMSPSQVNASQYCGIFYAGGHGAMWDLPENIEIAKICSAIYESGGVVGAVCHGPAGLVNVKLSNGHYLIEGKHINSFTNEEETQRGLASIVPFLLQSKLEERGAAFEKSDPWQVHVVSNDRIITGQNPMSAKAVGMALLQRLKTIR